MWVFSSSVGHWSNLTYFFLSYWYLFLAKCVTAGDAWVEVHHNMQTMSDSIKVQLAGALIISDKAVSPTCVVVDVIDW